MLSVCGATSVGQAEDHSCILFNTDMVRFDGVAEAEGDGRGFTDRSGRPGSLGECSERTSSPPTKKQIALSRGKLRWPIS